jgi:hypothetical protein
MVEEDMLRPQMNWEKGRKEEELIEINNLEEQTSKHLFKNSTF